MQTQSGTLKGIAIRAASRAPMVLCESVVVNQQEGLVGDFRGRPGGRQVTVLSAEAWQAACEALGKQLPWTARRANLLVEGIGLAQTTHARIQIGDVVLRVTGETEPCQRMEETEPGLLKALVPEWRGGVCCQVVEAGRIHCGDSLHLIECEA